MYLKVYPSDLLWQISIFGLHRCSYYTYISDTDNTFQGYTTTNNNDNNN